MISSLIIYNQNISEIPQTIEIQYENRRVSVHLIKNSIFEIQPHLYCVCVGGKVKFQESKFKDAVGIMKVNTADFKDSLVKFLSKFIPEKLQKIHKKIELVRIYLMLNNLEEALRVLELMKKTPDVRMLKFFIDFKVGNNVTVPKERSKEDEFTIFKEFIDICRELDMHSMLLFVLEFINYFRPEYYFKVDELLTDRTRNNDGISIFKISNNKGNTIDTNEESKIEKLVTLSLKNTTNFENIVSFLVIYVRLKISEILIHSGLLGMASLFYSKTALGLFDIKNSDLKNFLLAKSFELCSFGEEWKSQLFDSIQNEEIVHLSFQVQSPIERFYILNRDKIINRVSNETSVPQSTDENINHYVLKSNLTAFNINKNDNHHHRDICNNIKIFGGEEIFIFDVVIKRLENVFDKKVIIESDEDNLLVGILDDKNIFYPLIPHSNTYYLFPNNSITIKKLIFDNGESCSVNFNFEKINKKSDLILIGVLDHSHQSVLDKIDHKTLPLLEKYIGKHKILIFEYLNNLSCKYFTTTECKTVVIENNIYFILENNLKLFEINIEMYPKVYQKKKFKI